MLTRDFYRWEFACKCGCGFDTVDFELVTALQRARVHFNARIDISSGCRCPAHNNDVGGSRLSQHKKGRAADITIDGVDPADVQEWFIENTELSVGKYTTFTHVDSRSGPPVYW